jgi:ribosome-associated protein
MATTGKTTRMATQRSTGQKTAARKKTAVTKTPSAPARPETGRSAAKQQTLAFHLREEFVELCNLLKLVGIANSGGHGKQMVAEGKVRVDGKPESRKTAKIRAGQRVDCNGARIAVLAAER